MAMWPFNRRKENVTNTLPPEVQQYYQSQNRGRMGMAWLIALLSLLVSIAIVVGLFFGGRWVYRQIVGSNEKATTQTETTDGSGSESQGGDMEKPAPEQPKESPKTTEQPSTNTPPAPAPQPAPQTGESILRTGPEEDL